MASSSAFSSLIQLKIRLLGISPMVWRRVLVPSGMSLRELHGVVQVAMGWKGFHLFEFGVRAVRYGAFELCAESPDCSLSRFGFHANDRFSYTYDMVAWWEHEVRIEKLADADPGKPCPPCTGGAGTCPPEDCGGVREYLARRDEAQGYDAWKDVGVIADFVTELIDARDAGVSSDDLSMQDICPTLDRMAAHEPYLETQFSRRAVNQAFREGRHRKLMWQQIM